MNKSPQIRHRVPRVLFCVFLCVFFISRSENLFAETATDETQRITSLIDKVIEVYGGRDAIEGIHAIHAKGEIEAFVLHDRGTYELYFKRGRKLRVKTEYKRSWELRILNGDRGYRATESLPLEEVFGPRYLAMVYHYKHLDILHDLVKGTYQIRSAGRSSLNGTAVEVFHLNDKEGGVLDIYIDEHSSLIVKVTGYFSADNKSTYLSAEFSDFKSVGGSLFPFRITNYAGGMKIAQTVIDKYFINPEIADSMFEPAVIHSL